MPSEVRRRDALALDSAIRYNGAAFGGVWVMRLRSVGFLGVALFLAACGGGSVADIASLIDTTVKPETVKAGETAAVTCHVKDWNGNDVPTDTTVDLTAPKDAPATAYTWKDTDKTIVPTLVGDYTFACRVVGQDDELDKTPATLHVTVGDAAKIIATVSKTPVPAGIPADVTCVVQDAFGNVIDTPTVVDPLDNLDIADHVVSSKKVGDYALTCSAPDLTATVEKTAAPFQVQPGDPAKIVITADPDNPVYAIADQVTVTYKVVDQYDNEIPNVAGQLVAPVGAGLKDLGSSKYEFEAEGAYVFTVTLATPWDGLTASKTLLCDQSGPAITLFCPQRGQTFQEGEVLAAPCNQTVKGGELVVKGQVTDISGVSGVTVNGETVTVAPDGTFEFPVISVHGLNVLIVTAADPFGHASRTTRGWYFSKAYLPVAKDSKLVPDLVIGEGAAMFLGQAVLDDGDHDPAHLNDIATILEVVLGGLDLNSLIGSALKIPSIDLPNVINYQVLNVAGVQLALQGGIKIDFTIKDIKVSTPQIAIQCREGGVSVSIALGISAAVDVAAQLNLTGTAAYSGNTQTFDVLNPTATTGATLAITNLAVLMDIDIDKQPGQDVQIAGKSFKLTIQGIDFQLLNSLKFDLGKVFGINLGVVDLSQFVGTVSDFIAKNVTDPLLNLLTAGLSAIIQPIVTPLIGDLLKQVFAMLNIDTTFTIPAILSLPATPLEIAVNPSSIVFHGEPADPAKDPPAGGRIGLNAGTRTDKGVTLQTEQTPPVGDPMLGAILYAQCDGTDPDPVLFSFQDTPALQVGLKYDMLNEALFMIWWSGMINHQLDLSSLLSGVAGGALPISGLMVTPNLLLPPIIDDCKERKLSIQLGDAYLDATFTLINLDAHIGIWLQVRASAELNAAGTKLTIKIDKLDYFETEIIDIGQNMGDMLSAITDLIPSLLGQIEGKEFSFDIPSIPIGGLIPGMPAGAAIQLGNLASYSDNGMFVFGGDLQ